MTDSPHDALREDPDVGPLVATYGELTLDPADDLFSRLVVSICRQQVSMASAAATRDRLFEAVEVTPNHVRLRKVELDATIRGRMAKRAKRGDAPT